MNYVLFDRSAVDAIAGEKSFQSIEFSMGEQLIAVIRAKSNECHFGNSVKMLILGKGVFFVGKGCVRDFLLIDLEQSQILEKEKSDRDLLLALQKVFRTAIRIWNQLPFTSSEYINETKSIVFPFAYPDHRRVVIERSPKCERLEKRGIERPLLVYKYGKEDAPQGEELAKTDNMREAGELYLEHISAFQAFFRSLKLDYSDHSVSPLACTQTSEQVYGNGFIYMKYDQRLSQLTKSQLSVVVNPNIVSPLRIDGAAGTGKTASMIMRAYKILKSAFELNKPFKIVFFSHSDSTNQEAIHSFSALEDSAYFLSEENEQHIVFTTLFDYCISTINLPKSQVIDNDPAEAKQYQKMLIADAVSTIVLSKYKSYRALLSDDLKKQFDETTTPRAVLISMLQHEFGVQIKGRTDGTIEEYHKLSYIDNALQVKTEKDKDFIFLIFKEYQRLLVENHVFDCDDIVIQALAQWNAPFWRRDRSTNGFDYIFVDEMHLFNINEQYVFHYLTKSIDQKQIPICFAIDYSQAIGDRGDYRRDYIEKTFGEADKTRYQTVFRSSPQITDFCAAISASGALMFKDNYHNPYDSTTSSFTSAQERMCKKPCIFMYPNDKDMIASIQFHIDTFKKELNCKNKDIAIISFEPTLLNSDRYSEISKHFNQEITILRNKMELTDHRDTNLILSDPYSVNGLEFKCVILVGVDEGRVPQSHGVTDISLNYLRYSAFNQLYLASSRAKYRLVLLGNEMHGFPSCLNYAIELNAIEKRIVIK